MKTPFEGKLLLATENGLKFNDTASQRATVTPLSNDFNFESGDFTLTFICHTTPVGNYLMEIKNGSASIQVTAGFAANIVTTG
jgi:hypothetical protein